MKSKKVIITTSWDDGHPLDIKLCSILKDHHIEGTIYTPVTNQGNPIIGIDEIKKISQDFEIGGHTYSHAILTNIPDEQIDIELSKSKEVLEKIIRKDVVSFCYPRGQYNKNISKKVADAGYKGGRTAELFRTAFSDPYQFHTTMQAVDRILLSKGKQIITTNNHGLASKLVLTGNIFKRWDVIAIKTFEYVLEKGGIWHLWGHSWEIEKNNDWNLLKNVLEYVSVHGKEHGAEFLTNGDVIKATRLN